MPTDPLAAVRYPDLTYAPNIPSDMQKAVQDIIVNGCPAFATVAARDSAYAAYVAAGGTLRNGRTCVTDDAGYWTRANGAWQSMHGLVGHGITSTVSTAPTSTTSVALPTALRFSCYLQAGRAYEYSAGLRVSGSVVGDVAGFSARITTGTPAATDSAVAATTTAISIANAYLPVNVSRVFQVATSGIWTVAPWVNRVSGTGTITFAIAADGTAANQVKDVGVALSTVPLPS